MLQNQLIYLANILAGFLADAFPNWSSKAILKYCFEKYSKTTYLAVSGLAIGSIPAMFISQTWADAKFTTPHIIFAIVALILGTALSYLFVYLKEKQDKKLSLEEPNLQAQQEQTESVQEVKVENGDTQG